MSKQLKGPYTYKGDFVGGGHNDVFEFRVKWYVCNEFHDTNIFFRGERIIELVFNEDGTIQLQEDDEKDTKAEKVWDLTQTISHWFLTDGTDAIYSDSGIVYKPSDTLGLRSPLWPGLLIPKSRQLSIQLVNKSDAKRMRVEVMTIGKKPGYWSSEDHKVTTTWIDLRATDSLETYEVPITLDDEAPTFIKRLAFYGEDTAIEGTWTIKEVAVISE